MKILVINCGSSSVKASLYNWVKKPVAEPIFTAHAQWGIKKEKPFLIVNDQSGRRKKTLGALSISKTIQEILHELLDSSLISDVHEIDMIGHRIVHGGKYYAKSVIVTKSVMNRILELNRLAPLHNKSGLEGMMACQKFMPHAKQIAVFDTAFHHTLPLEAKMYPLSYEWYQQGLFRYGFHGMSFQYCTRRAIELLGKKKTEKMVICHLGSGASLAAIRKGKSIDTTMGFTPLEGLMMDTRSGSIDPGILLYWLQEKMVQPDAWSDELFRRSGLLGVSGKTGDMKEIVELVAKKDQRAILAFDLYMHRLNSLLGSMIASLQGIDTLVFTAGIGEHAPLVRERVCQNFEFLGVKLDKRKNRQPYKNDCDLSLESSIIKVLLIHTQEAFEIARECWLSTYK